MREYTEFYGVLRLSTFDQEIEIEIVCKKKAVLYPVTPQMKEKQIIKMLSNHAPFKLEENTALLEELSAVLNDTRTIIFNAVRSGSVIDRSLIQDHLPEKFVVRTIGKPGVKEDRSISMPEDSVVSIAIELYPVKWRNTELDRCRVADYSEAV